MATPIKLIVGLGNPGPDYANTRHNAGAWYVDQLARQANAPLQTEKKFFGSVGRATWSGHDCRLLIPSTYMNNSGQAVAAVANFYKIDCDEILVAHDELDLPPGAMRLKQGGGHGGHNGLRDIISALGNQKQFARLRIGIGHPGDAKKVSNYVLRDPTQAEYQLIQDGLDEALKLSQPIITGDWQSAMNTLHRNTPSSPQR